MQGVAPYRLTVQRFASKNTAIDTVDQGKMKLPNCRLPNLISTRHYAIIACVTIFVLFLIVSPSFSSVTSLSEGNTNLRLDRLPNTFRFGVIADLDQGNIVKGPKGDKWASIYMTATLHRDGDEFSVEWDDPVDLYTTLNEAGRGGELSELAMYHGKLYAFDDRTGIMFEVMNYRNSSASPAPIVVPRHIFMEGDGNVDKGLKIEWATVKDNVIYIGSFGKEYTNNNGEILHANNLWIVTYNQDGSIKHVDWKENYDAMRRELGYEHPGYLLHESITWSPHHRLWYILPRRVSKDPYDDELDERRGHNTMITATHDFSEIKSYSIGKITPERGFSSAKFLPGSRDSILVALKSEEIAATGEQNTYITIFGEKTIGSDEWEVLLDETPLPIKKKFEGIEFIH